MCNYREAHSLVKIIELLLKIEHPVRCLGTMVYVYAQLCMHVAIFSICGKFRPVSNFTWLHALTLAACSYALLYVIMDIQECIKTGGWYRNYETKYAVQNKSSTC